MAIVYQGSSPHFLTAGTYLNNNNGNSGQGGLGRERRLPKPKQRVALACVSCRKRKIKCTDNLKDGEACQNCIKSSKCCDKRRVSSIGMDQLSMGQQNPTALYQGRAAIDLQVFNNTVMAPDGALLPREPLLTNYQNHRAAYTPEHYGIYRNHGTFHVGSRVMAYSPHFDMGNGLPEGEGADKDSYTAGNLGQTANCTYLSGSPSMDGSLS